MFYAAGGRRGRGRRDVQGPPPGLRTITIVPPDPPSFTSLPGTWSPTVHVVGMDQAKWAVFQVYSDQGDPWHWGWDSTQRIYTRIGFRLAKHAYDRGWLPTNVDLGNCPSEGPWIASASRSGNSINLTIGHDQASGLVAGQDGIDWHAFTCSPGDGHNGHFDAVGAAITTSV